MYKWILQTSSACLRLCLQEYFVHLLFYYYFFILFININELQENKSDKCVFFICLGRSGRSFCFITFLLSFFFLCFFPEGIYLISQSHADLCQWALPRKPQTLLKPLTSNLIKSSQASPDKTSWFSNGELTQVESVGDRSLHC